MVISRGRRIEGRFGRAVSDLEPGCQLETRRLGADSSLRQARSSDASMRVNLPCPEGEQMLDGTTVADTVGKYGERYRFPAVLI